MDKTPWWNQQGITTYDLNNMSKDAQVGLGRQFGVLLGSINAVVADFVGTQTTIPSLTINVSAGQIFQMAAIDANPIGTFEADARQIMQQGWTAAQTIALNNSGLSAGKEKYWLIQAQFQQVDQVREGDPTGGVRGFWNATNPPSPLQGPDGLGGTVPTVRLGKCVLTAIAGPAADTGLAVVPAPSANCVPVFQIKITSGQTTITTAQIERHPNAPFIAGLLNSHHSGGAGQAPQILLGGAGKEVQGVADLVNLPVTNSSDVSRKIPVIKTVTGNPNGQLAGVVGDLAVQIDGQSLWVCKTTGTNVTAVWVNGGLDAVTLLQTFPQTLADVAATYAVKLTSADGVINLPAANVNRSLEFIRMDNVAFNAILQCSIGTDQLWFQDKVITQYKLQTGGSIKLRSIPSMGTTGGYLVY